MKGRGRGGGLVGIRYTSQRGKYALLSCVSPCVYPHQALGLSMTSGDFSFAMRF